MVGMTSARSWRDDDTWPKLAEPERKQATGLGRVDDPGIGKTEILAHRDAKHTRGGRRFSLTQCRRAAGAHLACGEVDDPGAGAIPSMLDECPTARQFDVVSVGSDRKKFDWRGHPLNLAARESAGKETLERSAGPSQVARMHTTSLPVLSTPRLTLRPFTAADAIRVQACLSDKAVSDGTLTIPHPYPDGAAAGWIATHAEKWASGRLAVWAIVQNSDDVVAGAISLRITATHRRAEAGYWIAHESWGQGVATEALRSVITFGFDALDLHRIEAHHFSENPASGRVMQKVGMLHEGRVRGAVFRAGAPRDLELYGLLRTDQRNQRSAVTPGD